MNFDNGQFQKLVGTLLSSVCQRLREVAKTARCFRKRTRAGCDFVLISADVNRATLVGPGWSDTLFDGLRQILQDEGFSSRVFIEPWCSRHGDSLHGLVEPITGSIQHENPYSALLEQTRPRVVLTTNCHPKLAKACHEQGIPVLEILHSRGYTSIYGGSWDRYLPNQRPNGVVAFDRKSEKVFSTEFPVLRLPNFTTSFQTQLVKALEQDSNESSLLEPPSGSVKPILITLGYSHKESYEENPESYFSREIRDFIRSSQDFFFYVRLHPVLSGSQQKFHRASLMKLRKELRAYRNVEFERTSSLPLLVSLGKAHCHITQNSMACYEAADLGLLSLVTRKISEASGDYRFSDLESLGYVQFYDGDPATMVNFARLAQRKLPLAETPAQEIGSQLLKLASAEDETKL